MKFFWLALIPFITLAQITEKRLGEIRVKEKLPVIGEDYDFDDAVEGSLPSWVNQDSIIALISDTMYLQYDLETDDLRFPVSTIRLPASNPPTATLYLGGQVLSFPTNQSATVYFEAQIPHHACNMLVDSLMFSDSIWVHIHCMYSSIPADPDSVHWTFTYTWANTGDEFAPPTTIQEAVILSDVGREDSTHYMEGIGYIPSNDKRFSSMLIMSLTRDVSKDAYAGSVYLMEIDIHYLRRDYYNDF